MRSFHASTTISGMLSLFPLCGLVDAVPVLVGTPDPNPETSDGNRAASVPVPTSTCFGTPLPLDYARLIRLD